MQARQWGLLPSETKVCWDVGALLMAYTALGPLFVLTLFSYTGSPAVYHLVFWTFSPLCAFLQCHPFLYDSYAEMIAYPSGFNAIEWYLVVSKSAGKLGC
jgi:hypothetical protein